MREPHLATKTRVKLYPCDRVFTRAVPTAPILLRSREDGLVHESHVYVVKQHHIDFLFASLRKEAAPVTGYGRLEG